MRIKAQLQKSTYRESNRSNDSGGDILAGIPTTGLRSIAEMADERDTSPAPVRNSLSGTG